MTKSTRIMIIAAMLVFVSAFVNVLYAQSMKLDEPLIMAHYDDLLWDEGRELDLQIHYITNRDDDRRMVSLDFESLSSSEIMVEQSQDSSFTFSFQGNQVYNDQVGRYFTKKTGYIHLRLGEADIVRLKEEGSIKVTRANVGYSDGSFAVVNLGEIRLLSQSLQEELVRTDHRGRGMPEFTASFKLEEAIEITSLDLGFVASHPDLLDFQMMVDSKKIYSLKELQSIETPIKAKVSIELIYTIISDDLSSYWIAGRVHPEIFYTSSQGPDSFRSVFNRSYGQLDEKSVESYVKLWRKDNE